MKFFNNFNNNKIASLITTYISFLFCIVISIYCIFITKRFISKDEALAIIILGLGLSSISYGSDLRGILKLFLEIKRGNDRENKEDH